MYRRVYCYFRHRDVINFDDLVAALKDQNVLRFVDENIERRFPNTQTLSGADHVVFKIIAFLDKIDGGAVLLGEFSQRIAGRHFMHDRIRRFQIRRDDVQIQIAQMLWVDSI